MTPTRTVYVPEPLEVVQPAEGVLRIQRADGSGPFTAEQVYKLVDDLVAELTEACSERVEVAEALRRPE